LTASNTSSFLTWSVQLIFPIHLQHHISKLSNSTYDPNIYYEGKATPLQALTGPEGSRRLMIPDFKTIDTWRWQGCQPYVPATFTPRKYSWYSFLLEAESTPGPWCSQKEYVNEKFQWYQRESILWPSGL
jgi:hypothetical protein